MTEPFQETAETARRLQDSFSRLHRHLHGTFFKSLIKEIKPSSLMVMMMLKKAEKRGESGVRVSDIASHMGITLSGVTQIITGLEKLGFTAREMDPEDRRAVLVSVTEEGKKILLPASRKLEEEFEGLVSHLGEENSRVLASLMIKVEEYFEIDSTS